MTGGIWIQVIESEIAVSKGRAYRVLGFNDHLEPIVLDDEGDFYAIEGAYIVVHTDGPTRRDPQT